VIRNLARNHSIRLQVANRGPLTDGLTRAEMLLDPVSWRGLKGNIFQPAAGRARGLSAAMDFNGAEFAAPDDKFDLSPASR